MFSIQDLLARHPIPGLKQSENRRIVAAVLSDILGLSIDPKTIQIKDGVLLLSVPPVLKSALIIRQKDIQNALSLKDISIKAIK